jgi:hypothetical protein
MTCNGDDRRIFVASDLHIAERPIASISGLCGDAYYAFDQIARSSSHHKLIVAGDFFNNVPPSSLDCVLVRSLYERYHFELLYVLGQHDGKASPDWVATVVPQAGHISQSDLVHSGYLIGGLDYQPPDRFLESYYYKVASANYDIFVIHQSFREFLPWSDISVSQLFFPDNAPFLVISGDFHKPFLYDATNECYLWQADSDLRQIRLDKPGRYFLSCGNIAYCAINEGPRFFFYALDFFNDHLVVNIFPISSRPRINLTVSALPAELGKLTGSSDSYSLHYHNCEYTWNISRPLIVIRGNKAEIEEAKKLISGHEDKAIFVFRTTKQDEEPIHHEAIVYDKQDRIALLMDLIGNYAIHDDSKRLAKQLILAERFDSILSWFDSG